MSSHTYPVPASWKKRAFIDEAGYKAMYAESVKSPDKFWRNRPSGWTGSRRRQKSRHFLCL